MSTLTDSHTTATVSPTYARPKSRRGVAYPVWLGLGAVVVAGSTWFSLTGGPGSWTDGWFGSSANQSLLYQVQPVDLSITLTENGELKPRRSIELKNEVEGQATIRFLIEESKRVKQGDLLVELASDAIVERIDASKIELDDIANDYRTAVGNLEDQLSQNVSDIRKAESDLEIATKELEKYLEGDFKKSFKAIDIQISETNLKLEQKREELETKSGLYERNFVKKSTIDQLQLEVTTLEMKLKQNELSKQILLDYEKPMSVKQKQTAIDQARDVLDRTRKRAKLREEQARNKVTQLEGLVQIRTGRLDRSKAQLEKCRILAPADGVVQYPDDGMFRHGSGEQLVVGSKVYEGQTLIVLPDTSAMVVSTRIHEADRHMVEVDMPCVIRVPAVPGQTFTGKVSKIDRFADSANRWLNPDLKEHTTEVLLDHAVAALSPGDSARVTMLVDSLSNVLAVPVQCVYTRGPRSFVFVQKGRRTKPVEVKLGSSNKTLVQVTSGLAVGDRVRMHADEKLLATLPAVKPGQIAQTLPMPGQKRGRPQQRSDAQAAKRPAGPASSVAAKQKSESRGGQRGG